MLGYLSLIENSAVLLIFRIVLAVLSNNRNHVSDAASG